MINIMSSQKRRLGQKDLRKKSFFLKKFVKYFLKDINLLIKKLV